MFMAPLSQVGWPPLRGLVPGLSDLPPGGCARLFWASVSGPLAGAAYLVPAVRAYLNLSHLPGGADLWDPNLLCGVSSPNPSSAHRPGGPSLLAPQVVTPRGSWRANSPRSCAAAAHVTTTLVSGSCFVSAPGICAPLSGNSDTVLLLFLFSECL